MSTRISRSPCTISLPPRVQVLLEARHSYWRLRRVAHEIVDAGLQQQPLLLIKAGDLIRQCLRSFKAGNGPRIGRAAAMTVCGCLLLSSQTEHAWDVVVALNSHVALRARCDRLPAASVQKGLLRSGDRTADKLTMCPFKQICAVLNDDLSAIIGRMPSPQPSATQTQPEIRKGSQQSLQALENFGCNGCCGQSTFRQEKRHGKFRKSAQ